MAMPRSKAAVPPSERVSPFMRVVYLAAMLFAAFQLSYFLESATKHLYDFRTRPPAEDKGDLIRHSNDVPDQYSYTTLATRAPVVDVPWEASIVREKVPIVFYYAKPGVPPCHPVHYTYKPVVQALKHNDFVHFIGVEECREFYTRMGVRFEHFSEYEDVFEWFIRNVGKPVDNHVRWFILKRFMEKHDYARVLYLATEVMLYANATELAAWMFPKAHIVLPARWPSLRPPLRVNQYPSSAVGGHIALFSYEGLVDWCLFLHMVFQVALFGGKPGSTNLVLMQQYNDMIPMGWYTFAECWLQELHPPCFAEKETGITAERASLIRGRFKPRFPVESFCMPHPCHNSSWSEEGLCVFDNNFSITTATVYFKFYKDMKTPTSRNYAYYEAWSTEAQKEPVQFLAVHFQGKKKEFLSHSIDPDPGKTWGGSSE